MPTGQAAMNECDEAASGRGRTALKITKQLSFACCLVIGRPRTTTAQPN
jgi:hypothetical protein